jgi:hypothetical protein
LIFAAEEEIIRLSTAYDIVSFMGANIEARFMFQWFETELRKVPFYLVAPQLSSAWVVLKGLQDLHHHANTDPFL